MSTFPTSGPDEPTPPLPTISDVRHGWGLSVNELHQLLQAEPTVWEYADAGQLEGSRYYSVIYHNRTHGYHQSWKYNEAGTIERVQLFIPQQQRQLVDAFLAGSTLSGDDHIYMPDAANLTNTATIVSVYEDEVDTLIMLTIQYHPVRWADGEPYVSLPADEEQSTLPPPTISQARYGWKLPVAELHQLLGDDPAWQVLPQEEYEDGAFTVKYVHLAHNFCQCWDYNASGQMDQVRFLILPRDQWLIGAFLIGSTTMADDFYFYLEEAIEHPEEERLTMLQQDVDGMTHLRVRFVPRE